MTRVLLIMRVTYSSHRAHIESLLSQGFEIHLATAVGAARTDPRFAAVVDIAGLEEADTIGVLSRHARTAGIAFALTFWESDIVTTAGVNERLGHPWANPEIEQICREKTRQRELCRAHGLPSVDFITVPAGGDIPETLPSGSSWVVKPTRLSASIGVQRVDDAAAIPAAIADIRRVTQDWMGSFYTGRESSIALIEEYLPGREVTADGVVVNGRFHLAGINNKMDMPGPYFEEDYYTLPYRYPEEEGGIVEIIQGTVDGLGVRHAMLNIELRQDAAGNFRIVEFSTRMSGGQNYMNLKMAHTLDIVRIFCKAAMTDGAGALDGEPERHPGRMASCIKFAYRGGTVLRNAAGAAATSPFFRDYIPMAPPGRTLREPPDGWYQIAGSLSVAGPYAKPEDTFAIEEIARRIDDRLDILCVPAVQREVAPSP